MLSNYHLDNGLGTLNDKPFMVSQYVNISKSVSGVNNAKAAVEEDFTNIDLDIIGTMKSILKKINRELTELEEKILVARVEKNLDYRTIAQSNNCSIKKVYNVMYKYKPLIKEIIKNNF